MSKYKVVTLCGSTRFRSEFEETQKRLTLEGYIVISVGLFGHSGDNEVWENMSEGELTRTKQILDDMHKHKIDMSDEIYVINPGGYIGNSTWSEICYAFMTDKVIKSIEPIDREQILIKARTHIAFAEMLAFQQLDTMVHLNADYPTGYPTDTMTTFKHKGKVIVDPWMIPDGDDRPFIKEPFYGHGNSREGFDIFKQYPVKKIAKFIETIVSERMTEKEIQKEEARQKLMLDAEHYMDIIPISKNDMKDYPYSSEETIRDFIGCWSELRG